MKYVMYMINRGDLFFWCGMSGMPRWTMDITYAKRFTFWQMVKEYVVTWFHSQPDHDIRFMTTEIAQIVDQYYNE